ncbi:hypothetical protein BC939DRAFT_467753 [Gamsiella multidivaricata]|uniref:uncharacterized protein n=1 Tax=Gamsiella multidivaricata TaxID=101098 RepID=UPI00221F831F|nr:uncharacterized protein BC939DRAFT_467753 [Gamsiella multidivaricata]KAG0368534.1 hypothetical protein BGZ54_001718 [Gamsiella multidivaricata]KAI7816799.1 hypothetical protein BC939DRAFT_467753 [Gamsiella multidivaricata]
MSQSAHTNQLTIICLIDGWVASDSFSVKICLGDSADHLKNVIKTTVSPKFDSYSAVDLRLWAVSVPNDPAKDNIISVDSLNSEAIELRSTTDLSEVFKGEVPKKTIHILIQEPRLAVDLFWDVLLRVVLRTMPHKGFIWAVDANTATLSALLGAIYKTHPELKTTSESTIAIHHPKTAGSPNSSVEYPTSDNGLQTILRINLRSGIQHLVVDLETRSREYSDITRMDV